MERKPGYRYLQLILILMGFLVGCGGGEEGQTLPTKMLEWTPPSSYADGTPLDPASDLDRYEIYLNQDGNFNESLNEVAAVRAVDSSNGRATTSFDLANLSRNITIGTKYFVSIRSVTKSGSKSGFSPSAAFSY